MLIGAYVCPEVINAVRLAGLEPVLADTRADSLNIDMASLGELVDTKTLAIICTNVGGIPDDYRTAAAFGIFGLQQVPFARARAHDFAPRGYFKPLGHSFPRFNAFGTSHIYNNPLLSKGREI